MLQDVVTCIRLGCDTIDAAGFRKEGHADRHLKTPAEVERLFERFPDAIRRTLEIADRCRFSLDELSYQYPDERSDPSKTAQETLEELTWAGASERYPGGVPDAVALQIRHELNLIERFAYAPYFLTVNSIVRFARKARTACRISMRSPTRLCRRGSKPAFDADLQSLHLRSLRDSVSVHAPRLAESRAAFRLSSDTIGSASSSTSPATNVTLRAATTR